MEMSVRIAVIDEKLCSPLKCQLECISNCPVNRLQKECIKLFPRRKDGKEKEKPRHMGKTDYSRGEKENGLARIDEELCTGCGICPKKCPFHAISIIKLVEAKPEELVFSYGENAFELYRMALPRKGITAIVGENGCGKSTNSKLLGGALKPAMLPSKEIKNYFEKMGRKNAVVKPQELAIVHEKRKVGELLKKIDESGRLGGLEKVFDLRFLYEKRMDELSGGELQKVVVAAALLKERDAYVLDEPLAFLDYAYRIRLIEYLKENFGDKQVLVIDHDISLLSYLCGSAHVLYGKPASYGIVSQVYAADRAINMFLEGFIGPENVRFRKERIAYKQHAEEEHGRKLFEIGECKVKKGSFTLQNSKRAPVFDGELVGIAGVNGIGKSTLCSWLHEQHGESAMKKQIMERNAGLVGEHLHSRDLFSEAYVKAMDLRKFEFYDERNLSGGELQKLEVFKCLNQDKKFYILDEPTNMMDVTGRIALSKLLRKRVNEGRTVLIVDHDLEFLYNTVDRVIVMEGESGKRGTIKGAYRKDDGVRELMRQFSLSYRRDVETKRLKLNKAGSRKDEDLKKSKKFIEEK